MERGVRGRFEEDTRKRREAERRQKERERELNERFAKDSETAVLPLLMRYAEDGLYLTWSGDVDGNRSLWLHAEMVG